MALSGHRTVGGRWQKNMPTKEGRYWVATRDGLLAGPVSVINVGGTWRSAQGYASNTEWKGWWWSEPIWEPYPPPLWKDDP
jgi:hypothetical protein